MMPSTRTLALAASGAVLMLVGGAFLATTILAPAKRFADCAGGVAGGDIGGPFTLVDGSGAEVTETDVITGPTLVYFGFTFCPDICPTDLARNAIATDILAEDHGIAVTPVFISVDPDRDTPEVVREYAASLHEDMIGLTGSSEQVAGAARAYKAYYRKQDGDPEYYQVDHSTFTYLMTPQQGFIDFFQSASSPEAVADRVACFVGAGAN